MITKIDKRSNLFNQKSIKDSPVILLGYNCILDYKEVLFKEALCYLKLKREKEALKDLSSILHVFGKFPQRTSYLITGKQIGKILIICKPFFQNVVIEKIGDFQRTNQVFYKDQVDLVQMEFEKYNLSSEKRILVDLSTLISFDQVEKDCFVNFFASIPHEVELFY